MLFSWLSAMSQNSGDYCNLTLYLKGTNGSVLAGQKFKLLYSNNQPIGEWITDSEGKFTIQLKKNTNYFFESLINGRNMKTEFPIADEDNVSFELQLAVSSHAETDTVKVTFNVTDENGVAETEAKINVKDGNISVFSCVTDVDGLCTVNLKKGKSYALVVEKFGKTFNLTLDIPNDADLAEFRYNLKIKVIEKYTRTFVLENVYFDSGKWDIKPESYASLNKLYDMLVSDMAMKIEVGGHTDTDGNDPANMQLSQRRADAVKQYIVKKGISANRILTKGYGETAPLAPNNTEDGKAKNRRTEIKVITE